MATIVAQLARLYYFEGDTVRGLEMVEVALKIAEDLGLPNVLAEALNTKSLLLESTGHPQESMGLRYHALTIAVQNGMQTAALRAYNNTAQGLLDWDRHDEATELAERALTLAHKLGERRWLAQIGALRAFSLYMLGRWEEALEIVRQLVNSGAVDLVVVDSAAALVPQLELDTGMGQGGVGIHDQGQQVRHGQTGRIATDALDGIAGADLALVEDGEVNPGRLAAMNRLTVRGSLRPTANLKQGMRAASPRAGPCRPGIRA